MKYMWRSVREYLRKSGEVERINGAAMFNKQPLTTKIVIVLFFLSLVIAPIWAAEFVRETSLRYEKILRTNFFTHFLLDKDIHPSEELRAALDEDIRVNRDKIVSNTFKNNFEDVFAMEVGKLSQTERWEWQAYEENRKKTTDLLVSLAVAVTALLVLFALISMARLLFNDSYYSAVSAPFRWLSRLAKAVTSTPRFIVSYIVRRDAWALLQRAAMGLDGYTHTLLSIEKSPGCLPAGIFRYEDMPKAAEDRALARRIDWLARHFGNVSEALTNAALTTADIESLLRQIEGDMSLVHAAYYTDEECIERIAAWISGVDAEQPYRDNVVRTVTL